MKMLMKKVLEMEIPNLGLVQMVDQESGEVHLINTGFSQVRNRYIKQQKLFVKNTMQIYLILGMFLDRFLGLGTILRVLCSLLPSKNLLLL